MALDEPVRRYLDHALPAGADRPGAVRLVMEGRIDVGVALRFRADQELAADRLVWRARAGGRRLKPLRVLDTWSPGEGLTQGTIGPVRFLHADGPDTARAAAGRAAAERVWLPSALLPEAGVTWRAIGEDHIVATFAAPPEEAAELHLRIGPEGEVRQVCIDRWGDVGRRGFGRIPFGGEVGAERRFGDTVVPTRVRVGWWWGTPRWKPFFDATILAVEPL
jgi:hypothetical protein